MTDTVVIVALYTAWYLVSRGIMAYAIGYYNKDIEPLGWFCYLPVCGEIAGPLFLVGWGMAKAVRVVSGKGKQHRTIRESRAGQRRIEQQYPNRTGRLSEQRRGGELSDTPPEFR